MDVAVVRGVGVLEIVEVVTIGFVVVVVVVVVLLATQAVHNTGQTARALAP